MYFRLEDLIDQSMLFGNCPRPLPGAVAAQRLGMACAGKGMQCYLVK